MSSGRQPGRGKSNHMGRRPGPAGYSRRADDRGMGGGGNRMDRRGVGASYNSGEGKYGFKPFQWGWTAVMTSDWKVSLLPLHIASCS